MKKMDFYVKKEWKMKFKILYTTMFVCLAMVLTLVGIWAVADLDFAVGGDITYTAPEAPPISSDEVSIFHLNTMMQEVAASLLMEFEKWVLQAESSGTILKTPLDSQASLSSEEVHV